ncbi:MAG TPA: 5'-methylthioadenosine/adenosylhomocysteine nucleosidase [Cytophagales bacterium]|nr:5'-methylthioadenosine/adenosylhomocysteine nucleosidase [Cytophagales bacterium]
MMLIGILAPMPEEIELILQSMTDIEIVHSGRRDFYKGKISGKPCVAALSRIGKVASAVTAAVMIERFGISHLIVTGVAGGIHPELTIGDIVVATACVQHDLDARPLFRQFEAPLLQEVFFQCDPQLVQYSLEACRHLIKNNFLDLIDQQHVDKFVLGDAKVFSGLLCCGDQFIGSQSQLEKLRSSLPEALCVEMEGGAVGQVCYEYNVKYVVVRSISDAANDAAHIDFNDYIHNVSRHYGLAIVRNIVEHLK